jgi:hypothetical protein
MEERLFTMTVTAAGPGNIALIDARNLHLGAEACGWLIDYRRFRRYLTDKYDVRTAILFLSRCLGSCDSLYWKLEEVGFELLFLDTPTSIIRHSLKLSMQPLLDDHTRTMPRIVLSVPGGHLAPLVSLLRSQCGLYSGVLLITSDGDLAPLAKWLTENNRLVSVLCPSASRCSWHLRQAARDRLRFVRDFRSKIEAK